MKSSLRKILIMSLIMIAFLMSNFAITFEKAVLKISSKNNIAYASPKKFGGFKSGGFKSRSSSGGFKSGIFKSGGSKSNKNSTGILNGIFGSKNKKYSTGSTHRSIIPIFIPWGGFHGGIGIFSFFKFIFEIVVIIIIIAIILRFLRRRR